MLSDTPYMRLTQRIFKMGKNLRKEQKKMLRITYREYHNSLKEAVDAIDSVDSYLVESVGYFDKGLKGEISVDDEAKFYGLVRGCSELLDQALSHIKDEYAYAKNIPNTNAVVKNADRRDDLIARMLDLTTIKHGLESSQLTVAVFLAGVTKIYSQEDLDELKRQVAEDLVLSATIKEKIKEAKELDKSVKQLTELK
jgi:hypothetical protein